MTARVVTLSTLLLRGNSAMVAMAKRQSCRAHQCQQLARFRSLTPIRAVGTESESSTAEAKLSKLTPDGLQPTWQIRMLYDGDCPLCEREVDMLRRRDEGRGRIDFVDIASPSYNPETNASISFETAMGRIHAILPDGTVITNVEAFRRLYEAVDLGWVYAVTTLPGVGQLADALYSFWARYRLPITGRPDLSVVLEHRRKGGETCAAGSGQDGGA